MSPFDLLFKKKKKKKRHPLLGRRQGEQGWLEDGAQLLKEVISSCDGRGCYPIQMFSAKEIEQAIGQPFHEDRFYVAYEGTHEDRQIIIKVYRDEERELVFNDREMAFNEIATVTQIKHANVAKLLGCCFEMEHPILIYEKVPFILSNRLHQANPSSSSPISWEHRLRIAIEIAYAITYLHIGTSRPIVHLGIKSSNILLDEHNKPKLTDFSLSITIPLGETHVETLIAGTVGYLAPEYALIGIASEKSDVYSYGVLLLELLSGKRPNGDGYIGNDPPLHKFMEKESTEKEERLELILHNGLSMDVRQVEQAMACIEVAVGCLSMNRDERPAMKEVAQQLEQIERGHPLLGRRQGEKGVLEDARLLEEVISSCGGRGCYPIRMFSAKEIEQAIAHFFHQDKLFSVNYEGTLEDHQIIIKVYKMGRFREMAFKEIATVTQIKHANVAKLLGCCFEMEQPILIYEKLPFMLSRRLHQANPSSSLISWEHRLRIAIEIAYAVTYLHIGTSRPIVHRGIKGSNILLDEHNKPKLADFSLSITIPLGKTQVETIVEGRYGDLDRPHYISGFVSEKSDVYSYGALLLELLSGKRPNDHGYIDKDSLLHKFIEKESTEKEERLELILHNGLSMDVRQVEQAMACMEVAVGCISRDPDERPAMKEVTQQLEQIERGLDIVTRGPARTWIVSMYLQRSFAQDRSITYMRHPLLGRRQGEKGVLEDARLLEEVISSCDGRGCYPIRMFSAKEIEQAIAHFFHQDKSFSVNYEGTLEDHQIIIKVYKMGRFREMAFKEIATVTQIKHANVAKLLGCCFEMEQPILIYEKLPFMLSRRLHQANPSSSLISWEHRLRIAIEIAYAVTYLHTANSRHIVSIDITSSNILLDEHNKPKLFDFSLSITIPLGETQVKAELAGTVGYLDPSYHLYNSFVSEKSDVHSYGVVLLELLSGKRPYKLNKFIDKGSIEIKKRLELILHNGLSMDVRQVEQAMACIEVAVGCLSINRDERPAMKEVVQQLEQIERGELRLSSPLLRVQLLATVGSSGGVSQIRTQYESESGSSEGVSPR